VVEEEYERERGERNLSTKAKTGETRVKTRTGRSDKPCGEDAELFR